MPSSPLVAMPQEMLHAVIDTIPDVHTLKQCSVVCRQFLTPCRRRLFRSLTFNITYPYPPSLRSLDVFINNPTLVSYTRELTVILHYWCQDLLPEHRDLPRIFRTLSHVDAFTIKVDNPAWKDPCPFPSEVMLAFQYLLTSPTLHSATFLELCPCIFFDYSQLRNLANLKHLTFIGSTTETECPHSDRALGSQPTGVDTQRLTLASTRLETLTVGGLGAASFIGSLSGTSSNIFSELRALKIKVSVADVFETVWESIQDSTASLESLTFDCLYPPVLESIPGRPLGRIDLDALRSLRVVTFQISHDPWLYNNAWPWIYGVLATRSLPRTLEILVFVIKTGYDEECRKGPDLYHTGASLLAPLDEVLASSLKHDVFPNLRKVHFQLLLVKVGESDTHDVWRYSEGWFRSFNERGMLSFGVDSLQNVLGENINQS